MAFRKYCSFRERAGRIQGGENSVHVGFVDVKKVFSLVPLPLYI